MSIEEMQNLIRRTIDAESRLDDKHMLSYLRKGMVYVAATLTYRDHPIKDQEPARRKNGTALRLSYERKCWYGRFTQHWCPKNGYPYGMEFAHGIIPVDNDRYIMVARVKNGSVAEHALVEYGFHVIK